MTIPLVEAHNAELEQICLRHHVTRLDLFGSVATGRYHAEESDLDFVVEFQQLPPGTYADAYFGLLESLELLFGRSIDLVVDSAISNPYFRQSIEESRTTVYEAYV